MSQIFRNVLAVILGLLVVTLVSYGYLYLLIKFHLGSIGQFFGGFDGIATREEAIQYILSGEGFALLEQSSFSFAIILTLAYIGAGVVIGLIGNSRIWILCLTGLLPFSALLIAISGLKIKLLILLLIDLMSGILTGVGTFHVRRKYMVMKT